LEKPAIFALPQYVSLGGRKFCDVYNIECKGNKFFPTNRASLRNFFKIMLISKSFVRLL